MPSERVTVPVGTYWGRWCIVREAAPEMRAGRKGSITRVLARCCCGDERVVWWEDLRAHRSTGCHRGRCRNAWLYSQGALQARGVEAARSLARALYEEGVDVLETARYLLTHAQGRMGAKSRKLLEGAEP